MYKPKEQTKHAQSNLVADKVGQGHRNGQGHGHDQYAIQLHAYIHTRPKEMSLVYVFCPIVSEISFHLLE